MQLHNTYESYIALISKNINLLKSYDMFQHWNINHSTNLFLYINVAKLCVSFNSVIFLQCYEQGNTGSLCLFLTYSNFFNVERLLKLHVLFQTLTYCRCNSLHGPNILNGERKRLNYCETRLGRSIRTYSRINIYRLQK